jgi:hypothetical protein
MNLPSLLFALLFAPFYVFATAIVSERVVFKKECQEILLIPLEKGHLVEALETDQLLNLHAWLVTEDWNKIHSIIPDTLKPFYDSLFMSYDKLLDEVVAAYFEYQKDNSSGVVTEEATRNHYSRYHPVELMTILNELKHLASMKRKDPTLRVLRKEGTAAFEQFYDHFYPGIVVPLDVAAGSESLSLASWAFIIIFLLVTVIAAVVIFAACKFRARGLKSDDESKMSSEFAERFKQ